ncbi:hypothetical protein NMG60_11022052 [Bertholletia excelsa]
MKSRRNEDYPIPSDPPLKLRDRGVKVDHYSYAIPRRDFLDRSPRARRSLSPRKVEGSRRLSRVDGRSNSVEREDYEWDLGGGRGDRVRSRSPPGGAVYGPHYEEGISSRDLPTANMLRRYDLVDYMDMNDDVTPGLKPEYKYQHIAARLGREDLDDSRLLGSGVQRMSDQKLMISEDDAVHPSFRFPEELGPSSKFGEGGGSFSSSSANLDMDQLKDRKVKYPDPSVVDKLAVTESYREREKTMLYSRDRSYSQVHLSELKDYGGSSQFKDFSGTSAGISRASLQESYHDGMRLLADDYPRNSGKVMEPMGFDDYGQRSISDSGRNYNKEYKDLPYLQRDTFSPAKAEHQDYLNPRMGRNRESHGHPYDELYRNAHEQVDYDYKDLLRRDVSDPIPEHAHNAEYAYRNPRESSYLDHSSLKKQMVSNYLGENVSAPSRGREYLDSGSAHIEYERRVSRAQEIPHFVASKDREISRYINYGFERDAGAASHNERIRMSPEFGYETEMDRLAVRTREIRSEELGTFDLLDRSLKRKYNADAEISRHNSRNVPGKWYNSRMREVSDSGKKWIVQNSSVPISSRTVGYENELYQRSERIFDGADHHRDSASDDRYYSEHGQDHSTKPYKPGGRYLKAHTRPGHLSSFNSHRARRHVLPKPHNVWIRSKYGNQVDILENEVDQSDEWVSSERAEPPEDSEEFNQLVHKFFLIFSKKLNENPAVRRIYTEQGRAGSLFCIVCSRSLSKEFLNTQRLVRHAFMSHKNGLRAQHLGLQKAICVLLGWNTVVAPDVITWVPEALPDAEARAQKEDLILWPPVVIIHNNSNLENNVERQKVMTLEAVGEFLRGKGFSGGKFRAYFGRPANRSVVVVKFLGTFSGLQDAEKLHKYFTENNQGRTDFERVAASSSKGKIVNTSGMEELELYGYMGISEDLDKIETEMRRKFLIKSKKEIQDLADAPVKT